jgi:hypothetical protein
LSKGGKLRKVVYTRAATFNEKSGIPTGKATVTYGSLGVMQDTSTGTASVMAAFYKYASSDFTANVNSGRVPSIGSCVVFYSRAVANPPTDLDAGTLSLSGSGVHVTLQKISLQSGPYYLGGLSSIPASGGTYTFTATGANVEAFSATVNFPPPLTWTNQNMITVVNPVQGQTVTWAGGVPGTYVAISGQSQANPAPTVTFICNAAVEAGQFTIPSWVLLALPSSNTGGLSVENLTGQQSFTSVGLDFGDGFGASSSGITVTYQ